MTNFSNPKGGFAVYTFPTQQAARAAMLELPCVHEASDSGKLICTEPIMFGVYHESEAQPPHWEAEIVGKAVTHVLWEVAQEAFKRHGGTRKGSDGEPETTAAPAAATAADPGKVKFVREERKPGATGSTMTYRIHTAPDGASAKAFLAATPVTKEFYYVIVETPEGNFGRDIQGMYQE